MEVTIICSMDPYTPKPGGIETYVLSLIPVLAKKGVKTFIPRIDGLNTSGYKFLFNLLLKAYSLKIQKSSIIHIQRPHQILPFVIFYRKNPKVCTLHGIAYNDVYFKKGKFVGEIYRLIEGFALKQADLIIAVDENTKKFYIQKYPWLKDKIIAIPIGIDTELFRPMEKDKMRKQYGFKEKDRIILYVGRLEKEKKLDFLLKSFKKIEKEQSNCKLVLVGDGREIDNLENLAKDLGSKDIIFMGALEHDKIPEIMNCADVFALTSLHESGPIVIEEALACGVPIVTTDVGRVREFIKNDNVGRIVDRDEKEFAVALKEMINMDREKTRNACRKVAMDFSFEKTANKTIEVYKILQGNKNAVFKKK